MRVFYVTRVWSCSHVVGGSEGLECAGPWRPRRRTHSEIQNLTGVFGFLSYENILYRHKT